MSDAYSVYKYIVKQAGPIMSATYRTLDYPLNLSGIGGGISNAYNSSAHALGRARDTVYGTFNPWEDEASRQGSLAHTLGKEIGNFFLPKVYDPDDLGPYEEYSNYIKDTEKGEMYLREAAKLRRQARKIKREREREEQEREHASASRYF